MTNPEILIRTILGPVRSSIRPLVLAVDITGQLLFLQHFSMDDIHVTKLVYPDVAKLIPCKPDTAARRVERLAHLCWDALVAQNLVQFYLGRDLRYVPDPHSLLVYLAVYAHLDIPFFSVIEQNPRSLFQMPDSSSLNCAAPITPPRLPLPVTQVIALPSSGHTTTFPLCPACNVSLEREYQDFCDRCGQPLNWNPFDDAQIIYPDTHPLLP